MDEKDSFDNVIDARFEGMNGIKMQERELANRAVNTGGEALHVLVEGYTTSDDDYRVMTAKYEKNGFHPAFYILEGFSGDNQVCGWLGSLNIFANLEVGL